MNRAYLSLGSNTQPEDHLRRAVGLLRDRCDAIFGVTVSPVYESPAVDGEGRYLNAAVLLETELSAQGLKDMILSDIEKRLGRTRGTSEVTIDLDLVLFNNDQLQVGKRTIPDPAIVEHAYVAVPLADIAPDYVYPATGETLQTIASSLQDAADLHKRADVKL
ncbi:MAG: 2-amino-4-hydroxy-6-hydroxymethyldihydropteridine diphosphokinase [Anaerolineae bacterium]